MNSNERMRSGEPETGDAGTDAGECGCDGGQATASGGGESSDGGGVWAAIAAIPSVVVPLLPSFTCPMCLAAYSGVLAAAGLGTVLQASVLQPLIAVFLVAQIGSVAWTTRSHGVPGPVIVTVAGAGAVAGGRLVADVPTLLYVGVGLLVAGAIWNLGLKFDWPAMPRQTG